MECRYICNAALKKINDGFNNYLVAIDVFTRKAYGVAMQTKDSISSREAISKIITATNNLGVF